ncbi:hypothetical protein BD310DRAFT_705031 [Dichomitus squalens]|uniref:Uncharacterized protein n=1 Tax=Dichomitus squalens TaxID=114155 RepID=A0A4Q9Q8A4_9APHY|nr:hypothetical protein BD310DRAFT_705031 [Dichomitus squalens]
MSDKPCYVVSIAHSPHSGMCRECAGNVWTIYGVFVEKTHILLCWRMWRQCGENVAAMCSFSACSPPAKIWHFTLCSRLHRQHRHHVHRFYSWGRGTSMTIKVQSNEPLGRHGTTAAHSNGISLLLISRIS